MTFLEKSTIVYKKRKKRSTDIIGISSNSKQKQLNYKISEMCLLVFSVAGIYCMLKLQSALREITRGSIICSIMCRYLTANDLVYDQMK